MFLVDYLASPTNAHPLGRVLDLGCGTGICGLSAYYLGADGITLSDMVLSETLEENIDDVLQTTRTGAPKSGKTAVTGAAEVGKTAVTGATEVGKTAVTGAAEVSAGESTPEPTAATTATTNSLTATPALQFVEYNWDSPAVPDELSQHFDTVLCSDVLYDEKFHAGLLRCLKKLTFTRCLLSYKRRHDIPEQKFFLDLIAQGGFSVSAVNSADVTLVNISRTSMLSGLHIFIITRK